MKRLWSDEEMHSIVIAWSRTQPHLKTYVAEEDEEKRKGTALLESRMNAEIDVGGAEHSWITAPRNISWKKHEERREQLEKYRKKRIFNNNNNNSSIHFHFCPFSSLLFFPFYR